MSPVPISLPDGDPKRIPALDGLRGIAALVVVIHHALLASSVALAGIYIGDEASGLAAAMVDTPLSLVWAGREAVFVFFVLSGFVLSLPHARGKKFSAWDYYPPRLVRLYLPVWGAMVFAAVLVTVADPQSIGGTTWWLDAHGAGFTFRGTAGDGSLFIADSFMYFSAIWSLKWEIIFSVLLPLYLVLAGANRFARFALVLVSLVAIASGINLYLTLLPVFMLGSVLAHEHVAVVGWLEKAGAAPRSVLFVGLLLMLSVTSWGGVLPDGISDALIAVGALGIVAMTSRPTGVLPDLLERRPVKWLGTRSFSLYLVHEPIVVTMAVLSGADAAPVAFVLVVLPVALLAAEGFYRVIEHPSHRLARRLKTYGPPDHFPWPSRASRSS